jgi:putative holliday junction resolvase
MAATNILGLDIGEKRVGAARVNMQAKLPQALMTLDNDLSLIDNLRTLINEYQIDLIVVGLPRNLSGVETAQSRYVRDFCDKSLRQLNLPLVLFDETLSSVTAETQLQERNKYNKADVDAAAASVILEDYVASLK